MGKSAKTSLESAGWWVEGWQPQEAFSGRHFGGQAKTLKANSLDFTYDLPGMCAGGGDAENVFRS